MGTTSILNQVLSATSGTSSTGIDVTSAVNAILTADRAPERTWQAEQSTLAAQSTAINQLESASSSLSDAVSSLQDPGGALNNIAANSSDTSVVTASATAGTAIGNHTILVTSLATTGSWYSDSVPSSSAALAAGSFSLTLGGSTTTFQTGSGGINTLTDLASSINSQSLGVTASIISDSAGARLSVTSTSSGAAADLSVSSSGGLGFTRSGTGADAVLKIDGVPLTSASNTVAGAISGVTLQLKAPSAAGAAVNLSLTPDSSSITQTVNSFVTAYNTLIKDVNSQLSYDSTTKTAGALASDSTIVGLQSALLNATNYNSASGAYQTLASLGISTNSDGTLSLDTSKLSTALTNNFSAVTGFFQGTASNGFGTSLANTLTTYTDPSQGAFTVDLSSISNEYKSLADQTNTLELYLTSEQTRLTAQYNAADIALQQLPQKLKQINALLNPNSSNTSGN